MDNFLERHEAEHPFPEDVELIRDIDYMGDGMACHFMDIYRGKKHDKKHDKKLPIMFNLHGGGFLLGKKEESHLFCAEMSQKGFLVFSLEYPLAPESLFPQILRDLMKGIKNSRVYFQKYNGEVMLFTIQEYGLLETFLDYLQNMLESSFYTSEEAAAYVESIIYQLENGELS